MDLIVPTRAQIRAWEVEVAQRYPSLQLRFDTRRTFEGLEYSMHFVPATNLQTSMYIPKIFPVVSEWSPLEVFWESAAGNQLEAIFSMFPDESSFASSWSGMSGDTRKYILLALVTLAVLSATSILRLFDRLDISGCSDNVLLVCLAGFLALAASSFQHSTRKGWHRLFPATPALSRLPRAGLLFLRR